MFADSMILHAIAEAQSEQSGAATAPASAVPSGGENPVKESTMPTQKQMQQDAPQSQQQSQQQGAHQEQPGQQASHVQRTCKKQLPPSHTRIRSDVRSTRERRASQINRLVAI